VIVEEDDVEYAIYGLHFMMPLPISGATDQRLQIADLVDALKHEKLPFNATGDFIMTETTHNYRALINAKPHTRSVWDEVGSGHGSTWSALPFTSGLRLDHMLISRQLDPVSMKIGANNGSDHRPIVATIGFNGKS
jgi:endonuclease/exonuclease/phosphatase family metal-dependent hydrolase